MKKYFIQMRGLSHALDYLMIKSKARKLIRRNIWFFLSLFSEYTKNLFRRLSFYFAKYISISSSGIYQTLIRNKFPHNDKKNNYFIGKSILYTLCISLICPINGPILWETEIEFRPHSDLVINFIISSNNFSH